MSNKNIYLKVLFIIGVTLLMSCTSYMKGSMNMERDNYESAIEHFRQELSKNPTNWRARQNLGLAYIRTGQNDKAIAELQYVLGQEPTDVTALSYAPQGVEWGLGQNPNASYSNYYLGLAYLRNGQREEALETWQAYKNPREPLLEAEIKRQLTVVEISNSVHLARLALEQEKKLETSPPESGTVAVFYFKDVSPDNSFRHFQKAMAEMIITDLAQIKSLTVLERMRVQYLLTEMQMGQTGIVDPGTAPRAGRLLGAENLIVGSLEPGSISVNTTIASATQSDVVGAFAVTAEQEEFFELEKEIVFNVVKILGVSLSPEEEQRVQQYHTKNLQAVLYLRQTTGAFKLRGATNAVLSLPAERRARGVVAASTGNHGRALAHAARDAGTPCIVCMSQLVPRNKVEAIEALGAEARIIGSSQDEAQLEVDRLVAEDGMIALPPFDHPDIIAGQGSLGLEILEDLPEAETILVPLSGGGLIAGIAVAAKAVKPAIRIVGISMERGAAMKASLDAGHPVAVEELPTLADSLGGGIGLANRYTFAMVRDLVDEVVLVNEREIADAIRHAFSRERQVIEGAAAVGIAALLRPSRPAWGATVALLSGANIDAELHRRIIAGESPDLMAERRQAPSSAEARHA